MLKSFLFVIFSILNLFCFSSNIFAANDLPANKQEIPTTKQEFATTYDVVYDIDSEGLTTVTEKINLRNLTSQSYANQFKLIIGATNITDIKASDGGGAMQATSTPNGSSTIISVKFNQQVAGINKILPWTLQFKSKDFAEKTGKIWEIRAPKVSSTTSLESYNLTLAIPSSFGDPTIISPTPKTQTTYQGKTIMTFTKDQLTASGISASFGSHQLFDFDLSYYLENKNLFPTLTSVALPPDTAYQDVIYQRIEPKPNNVTVDEDGNYLAWYRLNRGEKYNIKVIGSAKLYTSSKAKNISLSSDLIKKYTKADKYWEKDHPQIVGKLAEILEPVLSLDKTEKVKAIYRFVVGYLSYDPSRLEKEADRLGAVTALNNPASSVCMEFTDLFIALARGAGIPARELNGYAYTTNSKLRPATLGNDILHSWPEYWDDKKGWVMVDPTWENTTGGVDYFNKLDLNHFVFAIKGISSQSPIPAGSYKYSNQNSKDIKVTLSDNDFLGKSQLDISVEHSNPILAGFPSKIKVKISNVGNSVFFAPNFLVSAKNITILEGDNKKLGSIPPFGTATFEFNIRTKSFFEGFDDQIVILVGGQKFNHEVSVRQFLIFQSYPITSILIVSLVGFIYIAILGTHIHRSRKRKKK